MCFLSFVLELWVCQTVHSADLTPISSTQTRVLLFLRCMAAPSFECNGCNLKTREVPGWLACCLWCAEWALRSESFIKREGLVIIRIGLCRLGRPQQCSSQRPENIPRPNHVCSFPFSCRSRVKKKLKILCGMRRLKVRSHLWYCIEAWGSFGDVWTQQSQSDR